MQDQLRVALADGSRQSFRARKAATVVVIVPSLTARIASSASPLFSMRWVEPASMSVTSERRGNADRT
jgi:hypothetical protein